MPCSLIIIGEDLDVDAFVKESKLRSFHKTYKGSPRFKTKPEGEKIPYSFCSLRTSKADFDDLTKQIKDTIRFLKRNKNRLAHIQTTKTIQYATIDFGIDIVAEKFCTGLYFPVELIKLAGDLGIGLEISIYPDCNIDHGPAGKNKENINQLTPH
jgi:hypothetical protein